MIDSKCNKNNTKNDLNFFSARCELVGGNIELEIEYLKCWQILLDAKNLNFVAPQSPQRVLEPGDSNQDLCDQELWCAGRTSNWKKHSRVFFTLPKTNKDTQNDVLERVTPFKHGHFGFNASSSGK